MQLFDNDAKQQQQKHHCFLAIKYFFSLPANWGKLHKSYTTTQRIYNMRASHRHPPTSKIGTDIDP